MRQKNGGHIHLCIALYLRGVRYPKERKEEMCKIREKKKRFEKRTFKRVVLYWSPFIGRVFHTSGPPMGSHDAMARL